jgi:hypothetical protein
LGTLEMHRQNFAKAEQWSRKAIGVYQVCSKTCEERPFEERIPV